MTDRPNVETRECVNAPLPVLAFNCGLFAIALAVVMMNREHWWIAVPLAPYVLYLAYRLATSAGACDAPEPPDREPTPTPRRTTRASSRRAAGCQ